MLPIKIAGLGSYLPAHRVFNAELEAKLGIKPGWIERATGVRERRRATTENALDMAAAAIRQALAQAHLDVAQVDAWVGASAVPHQGIPCTAALVQRALAAPDGGSACWDVNATCLSFIFALQQVAHMVAAGVYECVVVFSSEISQHGLNPASPESAVLFGEAAAAAVITRAAPGEPSAWWHAHFATWSSGADLTRVLGFGSLHHANNPATTPDKHMFEMHGPGIFRHAVRVSGPFLEQFFRTLGWQRSSIAAVVPHQTSRHGLLYLSERLGFTAQQVVVNLPERGNCIAASIPLAFAEAVHSGRIRRGDRVLLIGTGAGLTLGAVALTF